MLFQKRVGSRSPTLGTMPIDLGITLPNNNKTAPGGGGGSPAAATPPVSDSTVLKGYMKTMQSAYTPETVQYERQTDEALRTQIEAWLRPSFDTAIAEREKKTATYRAELDADAIARGMGASTYVTDVKQRQMRAESEDIASLETNYAAQLAKQLSAAIDTENARQHEVQEFNANAKNEADLKAYSAALSLFQAYKAQQAAGSRGGRSTASAVTTTTPENCEAFLKGLSASERRDIYNASTAAGAQYQKELIASVGAPGYVKLVWKYPA